MAAASLAHRLLRAARQPAAAGMAGVVALKGAIVALNFALIFLAARVLGTEGFGTYSVVFSAAGLFCVAATFGQQMLVMRAWGEYAEGQAAGLLKGALLFSVAVCVCGAAAVAAGFFAWLDAEGNAFPAASVAAYALLMTLVLFSSHLVRSAVGVAAGDGHANLTAAAPPAAFLLLCLLAGWPTDVGTVFLVYAGGALAVLAVHAAIMRRVLRARPGFRDAEPRFAVGTWRPRSVKLWLSSVLEASHQYLDVLIIGALMSPETAGAYFVTTRLANAFATASDALNMFSTRHIPDLFFRKRWTELAALLDSVARITALLIAGGLLLLLGGGAWLLAAFNPHYASFFPALAILSVGTAAVAAVGPSGSLLMLTGHEGRYLAVLAGSIAIRAGGFFLFIPALGITGAALSTSVSFAVMALCLNRSAITLVGLDCSVARLGRPSRPRSASLPAD